MQPLKYFIKESLFRAKIFSKVHVAMVLEEAEKEIRHSVPAVAKGYFKCLYIKDKTLTLACLDFAMGQEIKKAEKNIINSLNTKFEQEVIKYFRIIPNFS